MPTTPWRIAAQSLTVLDPDTKEPAFTLQFIVDHGQADVSRLRMVPANADGAALEMEFSTGGYVIGTPVKQPRWLKAFERVDPNLHLDDEKAAEEYHAGLSPQQQDAYVAKRDAVLNRKHEWEKAHAGRELHTLPEDQMHQDIMDYTNRDATPESMAEFKRRAKEYGDAKRASNLPQAAGETGPDDTDPNSIEAQRARSEHAGLDTTQPADEDRKGMVGQPPGGMTGEVAGAPQGQSGGMNAPNAVDQQRQRQGQPVDVNAGKVQSSLAG